MYSSFYGGRQGAPFLIVASFESVAAMITNFSQGPAYKDVKYDEYIMISSSDKSSEDNGKIYRRGRDYTSANGGAIYIGQVQGAPGPAPTLALHTIEEVNQMGKEVDKGIYDISNGSLIPGKYIEDGVEKFNDQVQWVSCSIMNPDGTNAMAHIGFAFPYMVVDFEASISDKEEIEDFFERVDDETHPFYQKWHFTIPKGEKGTSIESISVDTGEEEGEGTQKIQVTYNDETPTETIGQPLNYVMKTAISNDYHLLVLHSDPAKREALVAAGAGYTWEGRNDWQDLGSIKNESGILVGMNYSITDYPQLSVVTAAVQFLNAQYPNGLTGIDLQGKVVSVGLDEETKVIYAFDYSLNAEGTYKGWYYLGSVDGSGGMSGAGVVIGKENDPDVESSASALPVGGAWFVVE